MKKKTFLTDALCILLGSGLTAAGLVMFTIPNDIAPGGVSGIATAVASLTQLPVGALTLAFNIPLLIAGWRVLGMRALLKTLVATVLLSVLIDALGLCLPVYTNNVLLASVLGGVVTGAGMGLLLARGVSTGGTDLVALMLRRRLRNFPTGQLLLALDAAVVVFAVAVFRNIEVALYSGVTIFVASKTIDGIQQGIDFAKVIYVVTDRAQELLAVLAGEMGRGVTLLPAKGGFSGKDKAVLMTVARRNEIAATLAAVKGKDPAAFIILTNATEVLGEGFKEGED